MYEQIILHFWHGTRDIRHGFCVVRLIIVYHYTWGDLFLKTLVAYLKVVQKTLRPTDYTARILHTYNIMSLVNFLCNTPMLISSDQRSAHLSMRCPLLYPFYMLRSIFFCVSSDLVLSLLVVSSSYFFFN
jgi:hypothetical protein